MNLFLLLLSINTLTYFDNFHIYVFSQSDDFGSNKNNYEYDSAFTLPYRSSDLDLLGNMTTKPKKTMTPIGNATLFQDFFNEITAAKFKRLDEASIVIYGGPNHTNNKHELFEFALNFLRTKLRCPDMQASDIMNVRFIGSEPSEKGRPIQVMLLTPELKSAVMRNRRYIRDIGWKVEEFQTKVQVAKLARLLKLMKKMRSCGHFAVVQDKKLYIDHVPVSLLKRDLMNQFPYIPSEYFNDLQ